MLYAEFNAQPQDGIIHIPKEYHAFTSKPVRVMMFLQEESEDYHDIDQVFEEFSLDLSSFTFDRAEAHDR
jgi:hypothetical protein